MVCNTLWLSKNAFIHDGKRWTYGCLINKTHSLLRESCMVHSFVFKSIIVNPYVSGLLSNDWMVHYHLSLQLSVWNKPLMYRAKLNVDGLSIGNLGMTGYGDSNGNLIFGFSKHLGNGTNLEVEAFGLLHGLEMCKATNF
ncbi:hypothetical protein ACH5RR_033629 [Cinchona calisaya]|uniref:RNase H type-1 domain-containing protein n=1 Tax=Cinchona calisaya TaxID=153742 RepID=A0ABD2Y8H3_9GENT